MANSDFPCKATRYQNYNTCMMQVEPVAVQQYGERWSDRLTRQEIRRMCRAGVYAQGERHYKAGRVVNARTRGKAVEATVTGREECLVDLDDGGGGRLGCRCTCMYYLMYRAICEHIAAVLLHLADHLDEMLDEEEDDRDTVDYLMTIVPPERASAFLAGILVEYEDVRERFVAEFGLKGVRHPDAYSADLRRMFRRAAEPDGKVRQNLDFSERFGEARRTRDEGNADKAATMYRDISKVVSESMGVVEDPTGYYQDCFIEALECMAESIVRRGPPPELKREHISYLFERATDPEGARLAPYYRDALSTICTADGDLEFWLGLTAPLMPDGSGGTPAGGGREVVRMRAQILEALGRPGEALGLLGGLYLTDSGLCAMYLSMLRDGADQDRTAEAAAKAAAAFPDDPQVLDVARSLLEPGGAERASSLARLFGITGDWKYFFTLKRESGDWDGARKDLVGRLVSYKVPSRAVDVYIREAMYKEAMDLLESAGDLKMFASYRTSLAERYPERYLAAYGSRLVSFAESKAGKNHQELLKDHLTNLRAIPDGDDQYRETLNRIRKGGRGRRILREVLGRL